MEEEKSIKFKKGLKKASEIFSYVFITVLLLVSAFLIFYAVCTKIAKAKDENPPFALYTIISPSMVPNIEVYDVVFVRKTDISILKTGDIITFYSTNTYFGNTPITHRIIEVLEDENKTKYFRVKGDANAVADDEKVMGEKIIGKVLFKIPKLGKIQYFLASRKGWLLAILIPSVVILAYDIFKIVRLIMLKKKLNNINNENKDLIEEIEEKRKEEIVSENQDKQVIDIKNKEE